MMLAVVSALFLAAAPADGANAPKAAPGLTLTMHADSRSLVDGNTWKLGPQGLGRPFAIHLIFNNEGKEPLQIWDLHNTEGSASLTFVLTDENSKQTELRTPLIPRITGVPSVWKFLGANSPHNAPRVHAVDLLRLVGERSLPPGKYKLHVIYENDIKNDSPFIPGPVWNGRLETKPVEMEIVRPDVFNAKIRG